MDITSRELYDKLNCVTENVYSAQLLCDGLSVNLSSFYTKLIKDAARCNDYSSDVIYDINNINDCLKEFDPGKEFTPVWIGFRKLGVDGTSYVLANAGKFEKYFMLYSVNIKHARGFDQFYDIIVRTYNV